MASEIINGPAPEQPIHPNCRCIMVPVLIGDAEATQGGPNYHDWFEGQDANTKLDILGPSRYREYRDGHITIDGFTNERNQIKTLEQLGIDRITRRELVDFAPRFSFTADNIPKTIDEFLAFEAANYNVGSQSTLNTHVSLWKAELKRLGIDIPQGKPLLEDLLKLSPTNTVNVMPPTPVQPSALPSVKTPPIAASSAPVSTFNTDSKMNYKELEVFYGENSSVEEIKNKFQQRFPFVDFQINNSASKEVARGIAIEYDSMLSKYKMNNDALKTIRYGNNNDYFGKEGKAPAFYNEANKEIVFNPIWLRDVRAGYTDLVDGNRIRNISTHEFGHAVDWFYKNSMGNKTRATDNFIKMFKDWKESADSISEYAVTKETEFFAEAFRMYKLNKFGKNPSDDWKLIIDFFDKLGIIR